MFIENNDYLNILKNSHVVSVDLIIMDTTDNVLLGKRNNAPAKDFWFVPGGRIQKNETLDDAIKRISLQETGNSLSKTNFIGLYHHNYNDNYDNNSFGTNYIVLGVGVKINNNINISPDKQHDDFKWWSISDLMASQNVHINTKNYFNPIPNNKVFN